MNNNVNNIKINLPQEINIDNLTSFINVYKKGIITYNDNNINYL